VKCWPDPAKTTINETTRVFGERVRDRPQALGLSQEAAALLAAFIGLSSTRWNGASAAYGWRRSSGSLTASKLLPGIWSASCQSGRKRGNQCH